MFVALLEGLAFFAPLILVFAGQDASLLLISFFTVLVIIAHQLIVHRRRIVKWVTVRRVMACVMVFLVVLFSSSAGLALIGQGPLASIGLSSPGFLFQNVWSIPDVANASWPYMVRYYHVSPLSILGPTIPVSSGFQAFNQLGLDVGQFDGVWAALLQHSGPLNSADQAHMQTLASATVFPFIQQDSPANMALSYWTGQFGSIATGSVTISKVTYPNYASFLHEVETSTAFAQQISLLSHWGWTQTCTSSASCVNGQTVFVPAGRYWTPMSLGLVIESLSQLGNYTQSSIVASLEAMGYTPSLVTDGLAQANSFAGTSLALIPDPGVYGSNPITISPGTPEPVFVADQYGNLVYGNAQVNFAANAPGTSGFGTGSLNPGFGGGPSPADVNNWIQSGCGTGGGCSFGPVANFWAAVEQNGGWGAVQGGYVPSLEVPTAVVSAAGQLVTQPGFTLPYTNPAATPQIVPGNCAGAACTGPGTTFAGQSALQAGGTAVSSFYDVVNVVYHGYPITSAQPGVNGVGPHPPQGTTCASGCNSPASWANAVAMVAVDQLAAQAYHAQTGNYLYFGQPLLEQGTQPGYGAGGRMPTPVDALATALFNDPGGNPVYGPGALAAMDPASATGQKLVSSMISAGRCSDAASCESAYVANLEVTAYFDPANPDSVTTWFGGGGTTGASLGQNTACGTHGCGWTMGVPSFIMDPHCTDSVCSNAVQSLFGQNCAGSGCTTHYLISDYMQMFNDILTNPDYASIKSLLTNAGITDAKSYAQVQAAIDEQFAGGQLTQLDAAAVQTMGSWILDGLAASGPNGCDNVCEAAAKAVFSLPFGGTPGIPGGYGYSSYNPQAPITNYQQWYESCGVSSCGQLTVNGQVVTNTQAVYEALQSIVIGGGITAGQFLSLQGTYTGSAWSVTAPMIEFVIESCNGSCSSLQQAQAALTKYLESKGINTADPPAPEKDSSGKADPPSPSKSGGLPGNSYSSAAEAAAAGKTYWADNPNLRTASYSGISAGRGTTAPAGSPPGGLSNPNSVSYQRLALLTTVPLLSFNLLSLDGAVQPGFAVLGSFYMSWFQVAILLLSVGLFLYLLLSWKALKGKRLRVLSLILGLGVLSVVALVAYAGIGFAGLLNSVFSVILIVVAIMLFLLACWKKKR